MEGLVREDHPAPPPTISAKTMARGKLKKAQVLVVEDNLTDAILIRSLLEQDERLRVTLAQDGIRGCQLVEGQRWDLVVTDINLPGRDGIEVIQACKASQPLTPTTIKFQCFYAVLIGYFGGPVNNLFARVQSPPYPNLRFLA